MSEAYWDASLETMPREELLRWQQERLRQHLAYVYEHSPYYRRAFDEAGVAPNDITGLDAFVAAVPCVTKMQIIEDQREHPPFGRMVTVRPEDLVRIYWSPGPEMIVFTPSDYAHVIDLAAKAFYTCGVRREDIVNVTCTYHWVIAGTVIDEAFRKIGCAVIPGGPDRAGCMWRSCGRRERPCSLRSSPLPKSWGRWPSRWGSIRRAISRCVWPL